jgi:CelD/BcsL family acetyltransferase involved in cellulose biosynthesis
MRVALLDPASSDERDLARWRALAAGAVAPNPFFEPGMVLPAMRLLRRSSRSRLLVVAGRDDWQLAMPVNVAPGSLAISTWRHPYCFYGMPLVASRGGDQALLLLAQWLQDHRRIHVLQLSQVPVGASPLGTLTSALRARGRSTVWARVVDRPVQSVRAGDPPPRRSRNLCDRRSELCHHVGALRVVRSQLPDDAEVVSGVAKFLELEAGGWKGRAGTAVAQHPRHLAFLWDAVRTLHEAGRLQVWRLFAGDTCVAAQLNIVVAPVVFSFKAAYDDAFSRFSPGTILLAEILDQLREDPAVDLVDSMTLAQNPTVNRLFKERVRLGTLLAATTGRTSDALVRSAPAVLSFRGKLLAGSRTSLGKELTTNAGVQG